MRRYEIRDEQWERIKELLPPEKKIKGLPAKDNRQMINAMLWIVRSARLVQRDCDWWFYKERHLVEYFFNKIKHYRRLATCFDKLSALFYPLVSLILKTRPSKVIQKTKTF